MRSSIILLLFAVACLDAQSPLTSTTPTAPAERLPEGLDREIIVTAMDATKPEVATCTDKAPHAEGIVKIHVVVGPDGSVTEVTITKAPDPTLGECVAEIVRQAAFSQTRRGGSFTYPFVF
jgi:TonB family protein